MALFLRFDPLALRFQSHPSPLSQLKTKHHPFHQPQKFHPLTLTKRKAAKMHQHPHKPAQNLKNLNDKHQLNRTAGSLEQRNVISRYHRPLRQSLASSHHSQRGKLPFHG